MKTPLPALLAAVAISALLSSCVPAPTLGEPVASPSSSSAPADDAVVEIPAEAGPATEQAAIAAALAGLTAYAQPDLDADAWMEGMYPHLTQQGAEAYLGTDPGRIPVRQVISAGTVLEGSTEVALIVQFETDAGIYNVSMSRAGSEAPWLAARLQPVGS